MTLRKSVEDTVRKLSRIYGLPQPKWRFARRDEELQEWYDQDTRTLVFARDTCPDMSGVRHEFLHYVCDVTCEKFPGEFVTVQHGGEVWEGICSEDLAEQFMDRRLEDC